MNFKEIQLTGFKSFADKTTIRFDDGVTCIVGPNGCGKSNVADAVRWVLGEQSAKTLRGTSMQDVIFNGTETRRALSFCEVTLIFDNTNRIFDVDFDEVGMTRRLYRSGESEYLMNKKPCRLKDIVTLLHGVGIGKEGYSIIGQGKVEQIMNAKPEDRRAIFEEATGVMKFKSQKAEIERKLESAKDNLTVFLQRIDEIEHQLKPLEKQAETARKYREYSEQLKYEEVNAYLARVENFENETRKHRNYIEEAEKKLTELDEEIASIDEQDGAFRLKTVEEDDKLSQLNEKLREFEVGLEHKSGEARLISERIASYKRQLSIAEDEVESSLRRDKEIDELTQKGEEEGKEDEKQAKALDEETTKLSKRIREVETRLAVFERISDEKRASELSSVENLADVRANVGSLSAQKTAAGERMDEVKAAIDKAVFRKTEYTIQYEECLKEKKECEEFLNGKAKKEAELDENLKDLALTAKSLAQEYTDCRTSIANYKNNLDFYTNLKNRFDGYRDSVRILQLKAKSDPKIGNRVKGAIADIVSTDQKYEVAIETAFGAAMQNIVTATQDDARYLIEYLKQTGGGVVTFLPVDAMRPRANSVEIKKAYHEAGALGLAEDLVRYDSYYHNVIGNLLGNTLICDTIASATAISKRYPRSFRIVTLDGDIIATSGAMTGGSKKKESGNLLAGERNIKDCELMIKRKTAAAEKLKAAIEECDRSQEEAKKEMEEFRLLAQQKTADYAALSQKEATLKELLADAESTLMEYEGLRQRLEKRMGDLENEAMTTAENEELLNKIRSEAAAEAAQHSVQADELKKELDALRDKLQELRVESATLASKRETAKDNLARLAEEKVTIASRVRDMRQTIASAGNIIQRLKLEEEKVALTEDEQKTVAEIRSQISSLEQEKKETAEKQLEIASRKRDALAEQQTISDKKHECELAISRAEVSLENMKQRIDEAYGLTYVNAKELRDENYDISQSSSNINSLKHKIAALGLVNHNAEEDYEVMSARYNEMQTQKDDLEKGIEDLTVVLYDLRDEMQRKFDAGFNDINKNFTQIFKELFGGGKAEMQLDYTDCVDPLDAGVEIIACPPGKKLTKISLLSGGERALTAIAILFAILKSRPMPFCILDEIEAALDEANVDRFAVYLKKFSKETQFIVITHRKPTMTKADTLFGVTMEEKGVSKIVSVKLSEVETKLGGDTIIA